MGVTSGGASLTERPDGRELPGGWAGDLAWSGDAAWVAWTACHDPEPDAADLCASGMALAARPDPDRVAPPFRRGARCHALADPPRRPGSDNRPWIWPGAGTSSKGQP